MIDPSTIDFNTFYVSKNSPDAGKNKLMPVVVITICFLALIIGFKAHSSYQKINE